MSNGVSRRLTSLLLLALFAAAGAAYVELPAWIPVRPLEAPGRHPARAPYHRADRVALGAAGEPSPCQRCHGDAPHRAGRRANARAFLNLHTLALDCGVCHLSGPGLTIRRPPGGGAKAQAGRLFAGRGVGAGWSPVTLPGSDARLLAGGPGCGECHRRESALLVANYDEYRRRLLEDLSVLYLLRREGP